jgi:hypothetical protein
MNSLHEIGWNLYRHYQVKTDPLLGDKHLIPPEVINSARLHPQPGEYVLLKSFIESLDEIENYEHNIVYKEKIRLVKYIYLDSNKQRAAFQKVISEIDEEVTLIYRLRNLIVHNAKMNNPTLNYFSWKAKNFAGILLRSLVRDTLEGVDTKVSLLNYTILKDRYIKNLENGIIQIF